MAGVSGARELLWGPHFPWNLAGRVQGRGVPLPLGGLGAQGAPLAGSRARPGTGSQVGTVFPSERGSRTLPRAPAGPALRGRTAQGSGSSYSGSSDVGSASLRWAKSAELELWIAGPDLLTGDLETGWGGGAAGVDPALERAWVTCGRS